MSSRKEWDDRFRQGDHADSVPDPFFTTSRYWPMIPGWAAQAENAGTSTGAMSALDVACGAGRHAVELARAGFRVTGIDFSTEALLRAQALAQKTTFRSNTSKPTWRQTALISVKTVTTSW